MEMFIPLLLLMSLIAFCGCLLTIHVYGLYLCFRKKWYLGLAGLVIPSFATIIGAADLFFKKDLLA
jgi:hypothetical protein